MAAVCPSVDSILIAQGTYYPSGNLNSIVNTDTTFGIVHPVKILVVTLPAAVREKNILQYPVVLSGNINTQSITDNANHIMLIVSGTADTTLIDGITFTGGYAATGSAYTFNGQSFLSRNGAGISAANSLVQVNNCTFTGNQASGFGGGVYVRNGKFISTRSVYGYNTTNTNGGAVCIDGVTDTFTLIDNAFFHDSVVNGSGGAVGAIYAGTTYADIENNVFTLNSTPMGGGGGIYIAAGTFSVINNTFYSNNASSNVGVGGFIRRLTTRQPCLQTIFSGKIQAAAIMTTTFRRIFPPLAMPRVSTHYL